MTSIFSLDERDARRLFGRRVGAVSTGFMIFCALMAAGVALFWSGFFALFEAWSLPEYSHGPLIPILSFYLFLRQLKHVPDVDSPPTDRWRGVALIGFTILVAMIGNVADIPDIVTYATIVWLYGVLLVGFGWRRGRQFWPPVLHLVFMLPLPAFMYWQLSINLQFISSELGVAFIRLMNIPVFLEGNVIDLGVYKLHVAEACSGLRYLFPVMSFSYIFGVLYQGPVWHKAVLLLSAAPITILMNSFRIGVIGVLVDNYGIEQAEGFLHFFEGWVIFIACVLILFGLARVMQFLARDRRPLAEALDLDLNGLGQQAARILTIRRSTALATAAIVMVIAAGTWHLAPGRSATEVDREPLVLFPRVIDGWTAGPPQLLNPAIEAVLQADDYHSASFVNPERDAAVDLFIAYYLSLTNGSGIHSPSVCIPAGGWEMSTITESRVNVTEADGAKTVVPVNRAIIRKGLSRQLVYYWFEQRGRRLTSDYVAKAMTVVDAVSRGRTDGALVRMITPIAPGESEAAADDRLRAFLDASIDVLPEFVPK